MHQIKIMVETYSGYKADERPMRFYIDGTAHDIAAIADRWYGPGYSYFKVSDTEGSLYILRHDESRDIWEISFFKKVDVEK